MPCRSDYDETDGTKTLKNELDKVTNMLCRLCENCELETEKPFPEDVLEWWEKHKEADEKRVNAEIKAVEAQLKQQGDLQAKLNKLKQEQNKHKTRLRTK